MQEKSENSYGGREIKTSPPGFLTKGSLYPQRPAQIKPPSIHTT